MTRPLPRRPLTTDEITLARALWSPTVRFPVGSGDQRWVRNVCGSIAMGLAGASLVTELTARRLVSMVMRSRRQMPADVLALAERMAKREGLVAPKRGLSEGAATAVLVLASHVGGAHA